MTELERQHEAHKARLMRFEARAVLPPMVVVETHPAASHSPANGLPRGVVSATVTACARYFGVTELELKSPTRRKPVAEARQTAMYLARFEYHRPLNVIASRLGDRDHTTILH